MDAASLRLQREAVSRHCEAGSVSGDAPASQGSAGSWNAAGDAPGLVWAFRFHQDGAATPWTAGYPEAPPHDGWLWLHLDLTDQRAVHWLRTSQLPEPALDVLLSRNRHQQIHAAGSTIYGVFADHIRGFDGASHEVGHLRFVMADRMLISGRHHALAAADLARNSIENDRCQLSCASELLELLIEHVADGIESVIDDLEIELDRVEDALTTRGSSVERRTLATVRRRSVRLHRQLSGLRSAVYRFERQSGTNLNPDLRRAIDHLVPRLDGLGHSILETQDRGHRLQDELTNLMAEETNRHLFVLSVLSALLLPPSLVAGVFGMNVKGVPLLENDAGFIWAMAILIGSSLAAYLVLRRSGLFRS
jgi:zinc transporter